MEAKLFGKYERKLRVKWWRCCEFEAGTATTLLLSDVSGPFPVTERNKSPDPAMPRRLPRHLFFKLEAGLVSYFDV